MLERCISYVLVIFLFGLIRALHIYLWTHMKDSVLKRLLLGNLWHLLRSKRSHRQRIRRVA